MTTWEEKFRGWAQSPSQTETERASNAERMVQKAIAASDRLKSRSIRVFTQGSYRNRTNIRRESDVDIGVLCLETAFFQIPEGTTRETFGFGPASYHYPQFKNEVGEALVSYFGAAAVTRGSKAFDIKETSYHIEADVAPFFLHERYDKTGQCISGVELMPDSGEQKRIINWPEQHYENGKLKNEITERRYRSIVRILKNLRCEMSDEKIAQASPITSFLCECLIWNVPNQYFGALTYEADLDLAVKFLHEQTRTDASCKEWGEVSELKYLFNPYQKWTREQAHNFLTSVMTYVGM